jgi:hypothetical protein
MTNAAQDLDHPDALQRVLAAAYGSILHAHTCSECHLLRPCAQIACEFRNGRNEGKFVCFVCKEKQT